MNSKIKLGDGLLIWLSSSLSCVLLAISVGPGCSFGHDIQDFNVLATDSFQIKSSDHLQAQNIEENSRRDIESYVLKWTNQERKKRRLPILETNPTLGKLAQIHSRNQAKSGLMAHDSVKFPQGWQTFEERMKKLRFVPPI
ncbi:MAG: CAP domain-containing protein, partial [Pseudomonadota bacterium]